MNAKEIADMADMIVAGYAYKVKDDYIEVTDLSQPTKTAVIQGGQVVESLMTDEEDDILLKYYTVNKDLLEGMLGS